MRPAYKISLCALFSALGVAAMMAAGLIPILTYCSPLIASIFLIPILREFGKGRAWMTWIVTAVLSGILCADKEAAFFFIFLGYYPILKPSFDKLGRTSRIVKLLYFAFSLVVMYGLILFVFNMDIEVEGTGFMLALYIALTAVMMLFDLVLNRMTILYERRVHPRIARAGKNDDM